MAKPLRCHVPAGTYRVSKGEALLMQAFLGTCVGLAVRCSATGVGGLIHFLLPEPVSALSASQPEKYASTGVPMFLQALDQMGARREAMTACLAGGALVGPLSRHDLDLDIGGRQYQNCPVRNRGLLHLLPEPGRRQRRFQHRAGRLHPAGRERRGADAQPG